MIHFENDYLKGAHPKILERLLETNDENLSGYGFDEYSAMARDKIMDLVGYPRADIYFLNSGTQTNSVALRSMLRPYEGVIAPETAHVFTQEAGAIESGGNKVLTVPGKQGKIDQEVLVKKLEEFRRDENNIHMVRPGVAFISFPTEFGTIYSKEELKNLYAICQHFRIELYIDGARLGYGLVAEGNDVSIKDIADYSDAFYIGGAKLGALMGEALVFPHGTPYEDYTTYIKGQRALIAKSRLLGVQFDTLLTDDLYFENARHGNKMAGLVKEGLRFKGYEEYIENPTNLIFLKVVNSKLEEIGKNVIYSRVQALDDDTTLIRLATSWGTTEEEVEELLSYM